MVALAHFKEFFANRNRYSILYGGAGSGKSFSSAQKHIFRILAEKPHRILVVRKVMSTQKESTIKLLRSICNMMAAEMHAPVEKVFTFRESPPLIRNNFNGNEIIFIGMDDPEKVKSIADITSIWIEEATELAEDEFDQLDLRLRGDTSHYKQIVLTFNPVSEDHWIKRRFFNGMEDTYINRSTFLNNKHAGPEYREVIERFRITNPSYYQVYGLGEWGELSLGTVFRRENYSTYYRGAIPADIRSVIYCDPNLAIKAKGDTTAVVHLGYSATTQHFYLLDGVCKSFSDSNQLLNTVYTMRSSETMALGFDGHVSQESTWTNFVRNWAAINQRPFYQVDYKRYRVDDLAKNIQLAWDQKLILFPDDFGSTISGKEFLAQLFSFSGKKAKMKDDAPDALICAFEFLHERNLTRRHGEIFEQPVIPAAITF